MQKNDDKYKQDGVNIPAGEVFSKFCKEINRSTYDISPFVKVQDLSRGNFRGPVGYKFRGLPKGYLQTGVMDGIGTKVVIIVASGKLKTSASNVMAMTAMDITRYGGLPLIFMNIFDVRSLGEIDSETFELCKEVMLGLQEIAISENYVVLNGETAELDQCVGSENSNAKVMFNWGGAMLGVYHPKKMILGDTLAPGQAIILLRDYFRSNGISSVRKALALKYGPEWWNNPEASEDIIACATPSILYDRLLNTTHDWYDKDPLQPRIKMHLISHLSGGAFEDKLGKDMLKPLGLAADIWDPFEPPEIMRKCAEWRGMDSEECYRTWNGGQGALVVIDQKDVRYFLQVCCESFGIEAKVAGEITKKRDYTVAIESGFDGQPIFYY